MRDISEKGKDVVGDNRIEIDRDVIEMNDEDEYNSFYYSASVILRIISFALFAALLIFIITTAFESAESFSYDNLDYIMRNYSLRLEENRDSARRPIRYSPDAAQDFVTFGNGLAVCGSSSISIFSGTGRQTCSEYYDYSAPAIAASDKYIIVYEQGGYGYSVFNAFTSVFSDICEKKIYAAAAADNGCYALITSSDEHISEIDVYNNDFGLDYRINLDSYAVSVDIADEEVMVVSISSGDDGLSTVTEITIADSSSRSVKAKIKDISGFPLECRITKYGYAVAFRDSVSFWDKSCAMLGRFDFKARSLSDIGLSETHALILFENDGFNTSYSACCLDSSGSIVFEYELTDTVFDMALHGSTAYFLTSRQAVCINGKQDYVFETDAAHYGCKLLPLDDKTLYYCSDTSAEWFRCDW